MHEWRKTPKRRQSQFCFDATAAVDGSRAGARTRPSHRTAPHYTAATVHRIAALMAATRAGDALQRDQRTAMLRLLCGRCERRRRSYSAAAARVSLLTCDDGDACEQHQQSNGAAHGCDGTRREKGSIGITVRANRRNNKGKKRSSLASKTTSWPRVKFPVC